MPEQVVDVAKVQPLGIETEQPELVQDNVAVEYPNWSSIRIESWSEHHPYLSLIREESSRTIKYVVWNFSGSVNGKIFIE